MLIALDEESQTMKQNEFPPGWNEERVQSVIDYYENQTEDEAIAEDESGLQDESITLMEVPTELVPVVLELISKHFTNVVMFMRTKLILTKPSQTIPTP